MNVFRRAKRKAHPATRQPQALAREIYHNALTYDSNQAMIAYLHRASEVLDPESAYDCQVRQELVKFVAQNPSIRQRFVAG